MTNDQSTILTNDQRPTTNNQPDIIITRRQFLVSWVAALESVPDIDLAAHLPELLDGLLGLLADPNRCVRVCVCVPARPPLLLLTALACCR